MAYDSSLDEQLFSKSFETETGRITVSVYSYNKSAKKVQIVRELKDKEGNLNFSKLGRLNKEELIRVMPLLQEALEVM
jgi:predicted transcriptional regulator